jgi:hypothetical protein
MFDDPVLRFIDRTQYLRAFGIVLVETDFELIFDILVLNPLIFERSDDLISVTDRADVLTERKQKVIELEPHVHVGMVHGFASSQNPVS